MRRLLLACLFLSAPLVGCETTLDPDTFVGSYTLVEGGAVLRNPEVRASILSDSLWLHRDGTARRVTRELLEYADSARDTTLVFEAPYEYRVDGTRIELAYVCPPNAVCTPPPHLWGEISTAGLILRDAFDPRVPLQYVRASQ